MNVMDLLEYQAKELFRAVGIPVLPSQKIDQARDIKHLNIPYPVVLKSQVYIGGRGRVGGVRFVENTIDAIAAAQAIFNLPIMGEYPQVLLAEAKYDVEQEFYLAVALNCTNRRPVLLGSAQGGVDVQSAIDQMQQVVVEGEFSPFYARRLALAMGLQGALMNTVSDVVEKMYRLFVSKDLDLVEINPLGVDRTGQVMALDGKVSVNDGALARHPDLAALSRKPIVHLLEKAPELQMMMEKDGTIGIIGNGSGLTMATMDWVYQAGGKPFCCLNLGGETYHEWTPDKFTERLVEGLSAMTQQPQVKAILINLSSGLITVEVLAQAVWQFLRSRPGMGATVVRLNQTSPLPKLIIRLAGSGPSDFAHTLEHPQISLCEDLETAIASVVRATNGRG
jgi:succinyl-CoA synthetase beta subunit